MAEYTIDKTVDAKGSMCPGPLMELVRVIKESDVGTVIDLISSDKGSPKDIPAWCEKANHEVLEIVEEGNDVAHIIVKKGEKKKRQRRRRE